MLIIFGLVDSFAEVAGIEWNKQTECLQFSLMNSFQKRQISKLKSTAKLSYIHSPLVLLPFGNLSSSSLHHSLIIFINGSFNHIHSSYAGCFILMFHSAFNIRIHSLIYIHSFNYRVIIKLIHIMTSNCPSLIH